MPMNLMEDKLRKLIQKELAKNSNLISESAVTNHLTKNIKKLLTDPAYDIPPEIQAHIMDDFSKILRKYEEYLN